MGDIAITFDVDWAPDFAIDYAASLIDYYGITTTWFMTHRSPVCEKLASTKFVEVGIHPNFLQGTTQGKNPFQIMKNLMDIFPEAKSVRTHAMVYSAQIAQLFAMLGFAVDSSIYLGGMKNIKPLLARYSSINKQIVKIPYYWSDDGEVSQNLGWKDISKAPGLKVLCFHPLHIFLNTDCWDTYLNYKNNFPKGGDFKDAEEFINRDKFGAKDYLVQMSSYLGKTKTLSEIKEEFLSGKD
ncbi:MAG: hypothetical protein PHO27_11930 [Sulfuricurvum sp.]|jgi:hypothetical protein|nr:hypothetical protein [Sulfuricurvum sp.]